MRPIVYATKRGRCIVEIEQAFAEDVRKRYVILHVCGPELAYAAPEHSRRWRIAWEPSAPNLHVRGILFGVHFYIEAGLVASR